MVKAERLFKKSGLSYRELGERMGYEGENAKKSAYQFLNTTSDPKMSMVRKFAKAMSKPMRELV